MRTATAPIPVGAHTVQVRELTVADVRAWAVEIDAGTRLLDPIGELVLEHCSLADLQLITDATPEALEAATAAELTALETAARTLNPHFFRVRAVLAIAAQQLQANSPTTSPTTV